MGTYADAREKTRNNLVNAFWDLYCEKDINKITIKEITDRAGYNRATFYIYFKNAQQVLDYVEDQLYEQMQNANYKKLPCGQDAEAMLEESIAQLDQNSRFLCVLLSDKGDPKFASNFREHFRKQITRIVDAGELEPTVPLEFALDFAIGGIANCLQRWYKDHPDSSTKDLVKSILRVSFSGLFRVPNKPPM